MRHRRRARASTLARYVSNGYVLLQPDIVYTTGYPGEDAFKCVVPAVQRVVGMGFIDPARIGIQGHSWGGFQITYLITRTDMFRAVEAGASVANMVSAYGGIRWGTGMSRAFQYERTQSRIGAPPWIKSLQFIENSPIFWVEKVNTPYLTIHNDEDDAVPWYQGIEFYSALRRLGKPAWMFNFNTEKHGLRERENQKVLDHPPGRVLRPLPAREAAAGVDGEGRSVPRARKAGCERVLQEVGSRLAATKPTEEHGEPDGGEVGD